MKKKYYFWLNHQIQTNPLTLCHYQRFNSQNRNQSSEFLFIVRLIRFELLVITVQNKGKNRRNNIIHRFATIFEWAKISWTEPCNVTKYFCLFIEICFVFCIRFFNLFGLFIRKFNSCVSRATVQILEIFIFFPHFNYNSSNFEIQSSEFGVSAI